MEAVILLLLAATGHVDSLDASDNYRARAYDPSLGRFLQRDPIGIWGDGINFGNGYAYVGEDPVNGRDPYGEVLECSPDDRGKKPCEGKQFTCDEVEKEITKNLQRAKDIAKNIKAQSKKDPKNKDLETRSSNWDTIVDALDPKGKTKIKLVICNCTENPNDNAGGNNNGCYGCDLHPSNAAMVPKEMKDGKITGNHKNEIYLCCKAAGAREKPIVSSGSIVGILSHEITHTKIGGNTMDYTGGDVWSAPTTSDETKNKIIKTMQSH